MSEYVTLSKRLRIGSRSFTGVTIGGVLHDERCLEAADRIDELEAQLTSKPSDTPEMLDIIDRLNGRIEELEGVLTTIANQKLPEEMSNEDCDPDYECGYDMCVRHARAMLKASQEGER